MKLLRIKHRMQKKGGGGTVKKQKNIIYTNSDLLNI